jgi:NadR type nicotinamide-nucleotide adenylyltransferase
MGSVHVSVDPRRRVVPCSASMVRADPWASWHCIEPPVRGWYAKRVCVVGAESTGTTTLAMALAERYRTSWSAEFGREYSAAKLARGETAWTTDEFVQIALEQNARDERAARAADRLAIGDTNSWATRLWHRRYMGRDSEAVAAVAAHARCDLYILTGDEVPFVQDGLRDGEHMRHAMHGWFEAELAAQSTPWLLVRGPHERRMAAAYEAIARLFAGSRWRPSAATP